MIVLTSVCVLGGLTILLSLLLVLANKKLFVYEDPRIDTVEEMLPHANCGACGFPGCRPFAEALVQEDTLPVNCTVSPEADRNSIAGYLGIDAGSQEKRVARLACGGGANVSRNRAEYRGGSNCRSAAVVGGGGKSCTWGCLGLGDCMEVCDFDAIQMNIFSLPEVDIDKCTACNDCVEVCPKDLFTLQPVSQHLWINCTSLEKGDDILDSCEVACTACERCVMDAPDELISMTNNLPVIDYNKNHQTQVPIQRCPTGAIVWLDEKKGIVKGEFSKKVLRKSTLPFALT